MIETLPRGRALLDDLEVGELANYYDDAEPEDVLIWAFDRFGDGVALVSSFQAEAMVLIDMAAQLNPEVQVITIDTGRLPEETHAIIEATRRRYGIKVKVLTPEAATVDKMVRRHGPDLFYEDVKLRLLCCKVRKVYPLQRALLGVDAWVTGLRREQWATRANIRKIEIDHDHGGIV